MASFTAGTTFVDGVSNDVTAAKLGALVTNATPTSGFIQDRTAETVVGTDDTILIGDASDSNNLKRMTVANILKAPLVSTSGTIDSLTTGTTTSTAQIVTSGTTATFNSTTGTIATFNSTTATIPTLTSITKITSGTGTAAAPAISPTGDTNTGIFFPTADTIAFSEGGTESMRIDSSGNVGIGTTSPAYKFVVSSSGSQGIEINPTSSTLTDIYSYNRATSAYINSQINALNLIVSTGVSSSTERLRIDSSGKILSNGASNTYGGTGSLSLNAPAGSAVDLELRVNNTLVGYLYNDSTNVQLANAQAGYLSMLTNNTERLRIDSSGRVGIGIADPALKLSIKVADASGTDGITLVNDTLSGGDSTGVLISASLGGAGSKYESSVIRMTQPDGYGGTMSFATNNDNAGNAIDRMTILKSGNVGIGVTAPVNKLEVVGSFGRGAPVTKTADFTLADTENWIIVNKTGSTCTVTLPAASSWTGREFTIKTLQAFTVVSASSNVVPRNSATAGTAILAATAGSWATLVSNGTNWVIMCGS